MQDSGALRTRVGNQCASRSVERGPYVQIQLVGPGSDGAVLGGGAVGDLVLEDVVAAGGVAVLVEHHRRPGASCKTETLAERVRERERETEREREREREREIYLRNWLMQLWQLATLKSVGQAGNSSKS